MKHVLNENFDWQRCPEVGRQVATRVDRIVGAFRCVTIATTHVDETNQFDRLG